MSFAPFERLLAFRYLRARRQEGFVSVIALISLLGIFLGVGTLIVVMSVMNGFRQELLSQILGVNGHLKVSGIERPIEDYDEVVARITAVQGVAAAVPQVEGQVMVSARERSVGGLAHGIRLQDLRQRTKIAENIRFGSLHNLVGEDSIAIGTRMAGQFGLKVGDPITLLLPQFSGGSVATAPRTRTYRIVAIFEIGMQEYDSSYLYMPLEAGQDLFQLAGAVNTVEVFVTQPEQMPYVRDQIRAALGEGYRTLDWQEANASFFNAINVERNVMFLILSLIILVAAFNITAGQYMLVKGKGRDIAILRTMGATRGMVLRVFFLSGASIGILGTVLGVAGGVLFAENIQVVQGLVELFVGSEGYDPTVYFLSRLPARLDWTEVLQVIAMSLALSFLAPLLPAWQAARLDPVEALRYE